MKDNNLIKDLVIFSKRKELIEKNRELQEIITEKICIIRGSINFNSKEDETRRFWELNEIERAKRKEIDNLVGELKDREEERNKMKKIIIAYDEGKM